MDRLRICQLITELRPAGAERSVYELSRRLDRDRFDVRVIALRGGMVADWLTEAGIEVRVLDVRGKWDMIRLRRLTDELRSHDTDILHTHLFHADLAGRPAAQLAAVPYVIHTVRTAEGRFRPWQFAYARFLADSCDRIVCVSESVHQVHARRSGLPAWRYTVIPNGIDVDAYRHVPAARRRLRQQWGISPKETLVAYVGRLTHEKGIDRLLDAISHLGARGNPINTVIVGDGPRRDTVENFIARGEGGRHARLLGFVEDVAGVLSAADIFVLPSRWEGWPMALGEAMAAGLPVIAMDVPGTRDLVRNGQTGILVRDADTTALAEEIIRLSEDGDARKALGLAAEQWARQHFRIEDCVSAHERLYLEVAGRGESPENG